MCLQGRDYWGRFERFMKTLAWSHDDVYIITGPLYVPQRTPQGYVMHHPMIGAALPTSSLPHGHCNLDQVEHMHTLRSVTNTCIACRASPLETLVLLEEGSTYAPVQLYFCIS